MKKFKKILSAMAALAVLTVGTASYAGAETPLKSANWETTYTHVPNGPSNTGYSETKYLYCGDEGNIVTVTSFSNTYSNAESHVTAQVIDNTLTNTSATLTHNEQTAILTPWDYHLLVPETAHYKFSSYTSTSGNRITAKGNIKMYP